MEISGIGTGSQDLVSMAKMMAEMRQKMFQRLDQNGDGGLDESELSDVAEKTGREASDILEEYDTNGDGVLDATEADQMAGEMKPHGPPPPPPDVIFSELDEDESGSLDETELSVLAEKTGENASDLLKTYDVNEDGALDSSEAQSMFAELAPSPPPPPPPGSGEGLTDENGEEDEELQSLMDALKESDDEEEAESILSQYIERLMQIYNVNSMAGGPATGSRVTVQA